MSSLLGIIRVKMTGWMKGQFSQSLSPWTCLQHANIQLYSAGPEITNVHTSRHPDCSSRFLNDHTAGLLETGFWLSRMLERIPTLQLLKVNENMMISLMYLNYESSRDNILRLSQ